MTTEIFLFLLLITSVLTGLVVEGIKAIMTEKNKTFSSNTIAGIVSIILAIGVSVGYAILYDISISDKILVYFIGLILLSWLCSMVGYDKVIQTISQLKVKTSNSDKE